jgi:hypothetical protein
VGTKKTPLRYKAGRAVQQHPWLTLSTLVSIGTPIGLIVGGATWVASFFVWKADFVSHVQRDEVKSGWHDVGHINLRVERLGDNVDALNNRRRAQGRLSASDEADLVLWQKKLETAAAQLIEAQRNAKATSKER